MKNILILADGPVARHFLQWVNETRIADNQYHVACYKGGVLPEKMSQAITMCHTDPTSFSKLLHIMTETKFSMVFVIMNEKHDAIHALKNVRHADDKIHIVLLDRWDEEFDENYNVTVISENQILASHLYDHLPNVPVIAQNIGLGEGEIMEILVPIGSSYAFRHVGSIAQRKWKIVAIYRHKRQIIPNNASMIRPNDTLLVIGQPKVLDGIYKSINMRQGLFPEPFGKNLYLLLDFKRDRKNALRYFNESVYLMSRLKNKKLFIKIINPSDFKLMDDLKSQENETISVHIDYDDQPTETWIKSDIQRFDIGLILSSMQTFEKLELRNKLFDLKKLIYLFGDCELKKIKECIIVMTEKEEMESISSTAFDLLESLDLKLHLSNFDPEGNFESKKMVIEHYESLSGIMNREIVIEQEMLNPVRKLKSLSNMLQITPIKKESKHKTFLNYLSMRWEDYLLEIPKLPKVLVPVEV